MGISWKDKVSNERVRAQTQLEKIDLIIKERRLRRLGHVLGRDDNRLPRRCTLGYKAVQGESLEDQERTG